MDRNSVRFPDGEKPKRREGPNQADTRKRSKEGVRHSDNETD